MRASMADFGKSLFKSEVSNGDGLHLLNLEARHLIFWILGPLLYLSRIAGQPDLKSSSRTDNQVGHNLSRLPRI